MKASSRSTLVVLTLLALLAAPVGAASLAICTGTSASVSVSSASHSGGVLYAQGPWSVSNAEAIYLEYRIDGQLYQSELIVGASGTFYFQDNYTTCNGHTFTVDAYPAVYNGSGYGICWDHGTSASAPFTVICNPIASMSCADIGYPVIQCTGTARNGVGPYTAYWQVDTGAWYQDYPYTASYGPWSEQYVCKSRQGASFPIRFKVRDSLGHWSNVVTRGCGLLEP